MLKRQRWYLLVGVALALAIAGWWFSAYPRGMLAARVDCSQGQYKLKVYGMPPGCARELIQLLRDRYGVEYDIVGDCVVSTDVAWYADGYNSVAKSRIEARFGKDIFEECWKDAESMFENAHKLKTAPE